MRAVSRVVVVALVTLAYTGHVAAQDNAATARAAFLAGRAASDEGRWSEALRYFEQAFVLTGSPVARFNEGFVLRALGRFREARAVFDEVVGSRDLDDATRASIREMRADVDARVGALVLDGLAAARVTIRVDADLRIDDLSRPLVLAVDPGRRSLTLRRAGYQPFDWAGAVRDGQRVHVAVAMVPTPRSVLEEPWLWIVVGALVLGGVAVGVWAYDDSLQLRPQSSISARF